MNVFRVFFFYLYLFGSVTKFKHQLENFQFFLAPSSSSLSLSLSLSLTHIHTHKHTHTLTCYYLFVPVCVVTFYPAVVKFSYMMRVIGVYSCSDLSLRMLEHDESMMQVFTCFNVVQLNFNKTHIYCCNKLTKEVVVVSRQFKSWRDASFIHL